LKSVVKKSLQKLHVIDLARNIYNSFNTFSISLFLSERKYRNSGLPDHLPAPPSNLIFLIIGLRWATVYWRSGNEIFEEIQFVLKKNSIDLKPSDSVLDFGCGCGRIIRHFYYHIKDVHFFGSDYNPQLIEWCKSNLLFAHFSTNKLLPPLEYGSDQFNLIYARSVFTHIGSELQKIWMHELRRVLKVGGYLYISTHGESTFIKLDKNVIEELKSNGIASVNQNIEGDNKCTVFQTKKYFEENLLEGFELMDFISGGAKKKLSQDIYLLKRIN